MSVPPREEEVRQLLAFAERRGRFAPDNNYEGDWSFFARLASSWLAQEKVIADLRAAMRRTAEEQGWVTLLYAADSSAPGHHPDMFAEDSWQHDFVAALAGVGSGTADERYVFAEGDARCGAVHELAKAVCLLPRGHEGDHRNTQGYWMPREGESFNPRLRGSGTETPQQKEQQ